MTASPEHAKPERASQDHYDVLVVGAGISGIDAGCHLRTSCPDRSFAILESRAAIGGTWDLFRYPGIRSDSDMYTFGFGFKPWTQGKAIADGDSILAYLQETVDEYGLDQNIRFHHRVVRADWSNEKRRWSVTAQCRGEDVVLTCGFLFMCAGYYSYENGYTPEIPGRERFQGEIVHPQHWPEDLDYKDKNVVVIGSGATAVTLVPAMAGDAAHVTMLQRSPTYVVSRPDKDWIADALRKVLPEKTAFRWARWKNATYSELMYELAQYRPEKFKARLIQMIRDELGPDYDVERHFTPTYNPWDQRLCLVPNSDLFQAIKSGKASVATDRIRSITENGLELESGDTLAADLLITATGLQLVVLGGTEVLIDGKPVDFSETWSYKGFAFSGVPNMVSLFGYVNASWTLRADLICEYVCRLLNHLRATGTDTCVPCLRPEDQDMVAQPWVGTFSPGYIERSRSLLPMQGDREPWVNRQSYRYEKKLLRKSRVDDGVMIFS